MDVKKEPIKFNEALDVNQTMNNLLDKIAQAITSEGPATLKHLVEIRDIILGLQRVDKTAQFSLLPDTVDRIQKALESVALPSDKTLKEVGLVPPTPDIVFKEVDQVPETQEEARQKVNEIINAQLDATVKALNTVIEVGMDAEKNPLTIPNESDRLDKVLVDVVATLFGTNLKRFVAMSLPEVAANKATPEINLNGSTESKHPQTIEKSRVKLSRISHPLENTDPTKKIAAKLDAETADVEKQTYAIGDFPNLKKKLEDEVNTMGASKTSKAEGVLDYEITAADKYENDLDAKQVAPEKIKFPTDLENDLASNKGSKIGYEALVPRKESLKIDSTSVFDVADKGDHKPGPPDAWYRNWDFRNQTAANDINAKQNTSLLGISLGSGALGGVGEVLSFFGVNSSDVARYVNSGIRNLNTYTNGIRVAQLLNIVRADKKTKNTLVTDDLRGFDPRRFAGSYNSKDAETVVRKGFVDDTGVVKGNVVTEQDLPSSQQSMIRQKISERGKLPASVKNRTGDYPVQDISVDSKIPHAGEDSVYKAKFQSRTVEIVGKKKATGFLKIYLKRGPKFSDSQTETQIIPMQFEPLVSGDSKSAEYSQISTLAKSQSAQVYRKSSERAITLELNYLVVAKPSSNTTHVNEKPSKNVADMSYWTEDYIYDYIVRNLRNLVLPNISTPQYKLAPPIVQVWYGGTDLSGSSTGEGVPDEKNNQLNDTFPTFRTNWYSFGGDSYQQRSYRSLWVCSSVAFDYKGGIVNRETRRYMQVTATLSLTEIAPSVTDNELLIWSPEPPSPPVGTAPPASPSSSAISTPFVAGGGGSGRGGFIPPI